MLKRLMLAIVIYILTVGHAWAYATAFGVGNGYVVTVAHALYPSIKRYRLTMDWWDATYTATLVYVDSKTDIAILTIPDKSRVGLYLYPNVINSAYDTLIPGFPAPNGDLGIYTVIFPKRFRALARGDYMVEAYINVGNSGSPVIHRGAKSEGVLGMVKTLFTGTPAAGVVRSVDIIQALDKASGGAWRGGKILDNEPVNQCVYRMEVE